MRVAEINTRLVALSVQYKADTFGKLKDDRLYNVYTMFTFARVGAEICTSHARQERRLNSFQRYSKHCRHLLRRTSNVEVQRQQ